MYSPQYLRHRQQSLATTADDGETSIINKSSRMDGGNSEHSDEDSLDRQRRERDEEQLRLAGLRRRSLMLLFAWLGVGFYTKIPFFFYFRITTKMGRLRRRTQLVLLVVISREGGNQFRKAICHLKALNVL